MTDTTICLVGDIHLGETPSMSLASEVQQALERADLIVANLEGPITDSTEEIGGKGCMKSAPETVEILRSWGVNVVSLANNHIFDYGWRGFQQTRDLLGQAGIAYLGAGRNLTQACRPVIRHVKGLKVAFLAYSWEFIQTTCAGADTFGCAPLDTELIIRQVTELRDQVDVVIVLPHWGYCDYIMPTPFEMDLTKRLTDAGATAIVGGHSHAVQGVVCLNGRFVAYNLGDFAFGENRLRGVVTTISRRPSEGRRGIVLTLKILPRQVTSYHVAFTFLREDGSIEEDHSAQRREEFERRCRILAPQVYPRQWRRYVRSRLLKRVLYWMNVFNWRKIHKETFAGGWLMLKHALRWR